MEIENLKFRSVFKCFHQVLLNLGSPTNRGNFDRFSEKSKCLKKKKKRKFFFYHFTSALFSKDMLRIVKGFAPWILIDCFEEKFLYPLECREVPSGS